MKGKGGGTVKSDLSIHASRNSKEASTKIQQIFNEDSTNIQQRFSKYSTNIQQIFNKYSTNIHSLNEKVEEQWKAISVFMLQQIAKKFSVLSRPILEMENNKRSKHQAMR